MIEISKAEHHMVLLHAKALTLPIHKRPSGFCLDRI
jgi:hypothetical protein